MPFHGLYIGEAGDDTAAGTEDAPFATLAKAASVAQPGDTIVFLDGTFTLTNQVVLIPSGVNVMAQNAGQANLTGGSAAAVFELAGDTKLSGLKVTDAQRVVRFAGGATASGTVTIEDSSFANCTVTCLDLTGAARAVVTGTEGGVLGNGGNAYALLSETSSIEVSGGTLQNFGAAGIFRAANASTVTLRDLEVVGGTGKLLVLRDDSVGTVETTVVATSAQGVFEQYAASQLTVRGSDISTDETPIYPCFILNDGKKLVIDDTKVHGCGTGVKGAIPLDLQLIDSEFYDHRFGGGDLDANGSRKVSITGTSFHDCDYTAFRIGSAGTVLDLKVRNTSVDVTTLANWHGIMLDGSSASTIDLGTLAEPGGNTFLQHAATLASAMRLQFQAVTIQAVGNTWTPSAQGANAQGKYVVESGKTLIDATAADGINYIKPYTTTKIVLAQIP